MDEVKEEENNNETNASSWWGSWPTWLQSAKEKSSTALEFMKRDLSEFKQVVQTDAVAAVSSTAAMLKDKLTVDNAEAVADKARQSFSSVLGTITDVFAPQREIEEGELMIVKNSELVPLDWWQTQLYMIRKDSKTFCHEPEGPPEVYENWLESFDIHEYEDEMTNVIMSSPDVQNLYDKLVPTSVSHLDFWRRYFYRVHLLRKTEAKRAEFLRKAETITISDIEWEKDEKLNDVKSRLSDKQPQNSGVKQVVAEINIQNLETSSLSPNSSNKTQTMAEEIAAITKTDSNRNSAIDTSCLIDSIVESPDNALTSNMNEISGFQNVPHSSSADSTDGSRSSPVESLGKDYSTGDEWEKDFELEINDLKNQANSQQTDSQKEDEDDWEKWQ